MLTRCRAGGRRRRVQTPPPLRDHVPPRRAPAPADRPTALTAGLPPYHLLPGSRGTRSPTRAADVALAPTTSPDGKGARRAATPASLHSSRAQAVAPLWAFRRSSLRSACARNVHACLLAPVRCCVPCSQCLDASVHQGLDGAAANPCNAVPLHESAWLRMESGQGASAGPPPYPHHQGGAAGREDREYEGGQGARRGQGTQGRSWRR